MAAPVLPVPSASLDPQRPPSVPAAAGSPSASPPPSLRSQRRRPSVAPASRRRRRQQRQRQRRRAASGGSSGGGGGGSGGGGGGCCGGAMAGEPSPAPAEDGSGGGDAAAAPSPVDAAAAAAAVDADAAVAATTEALWSWYAAAATPHEGYPTASWVDQAAVESAVQAADMDAASAPPPLPLSPPLSPALSPARPPAGGRGGGSGGPPVSPLHMVGGTPPASPPAASLGSPPPPRGAAAAASPPLVSWAATAAAEAAAARAPAATNPVANPWYPRPPPPPLALRSHGRWVAAALARGLTPRFTSLDASQPWLLYWTLHAATLLRTPISPAVRAAAVAHLAACAAPDGGGFGGGPGQVPHLATTYAAVAAAAVLGGEDGLGVVDRAAVLRFLASARRPGGGYAVTPDGEVDARGVYLATAVAWLLGGPPHLAAGVGTFVGSLVSFDGGLASVAGGEGHGGYGWCGLAAAVLAGPAEVAAFDAAPAGGGGGAVGRLRAWAVDRQHELEGGLAGRANKLVDSCYTFWVGGVPALADRADAMLAGGGKDDAAAGWGVTPPPPPPPPPSGTKGDPVDAVGGSSADQTDVEPTRLARYVLSYCQAPGGGLRDKPGAAPDYYHTCYALSGLSVAQHYGRRRASASASAAASAAAAAAAAGGEEGPDDLGVGVLLPRVHPAVNVEVGRVAAARAYWAAQAAAGGDAKDPAPAGGDA